MTTATQASPSDHQARQRLYDVARGIVEANDEAAALDVIRRHPPPADLAGLEALDADLFRTIEGNYAEGSEKFAQAAWGTSWEAVFPPVQNRQANVFDPDTAEPQAVEQYRRLLDGLWTAARAVVADDELAKPRALDRPKKRKARLRARSDASGRKRKRVRPLHRENE